MTAVKQGATTLANFTYDGQGRRAAKTAGGVTRSYVYDRNHVAEERLSGGATGTIRYFHGRSVDNWLGRQETDGSATFFVADHLRSVAQHTNSAGTVTLARSYDPWGNLDATSAAVSGPAFTGREWDAETGLYYYRARYYDPSAGRFIGQDPLGFAGDQNFYTYVQNNPVGRIDPTGLDALPVHFCEPGFIKYSSGEPAPAGLCCKDGQPVLCADRAQWEKYRAGRQSEVVACWSQYIDRNPSRAEGYLERARASEPRPRDPQRCRFREGLQARRADGVSCLRAALPAFASRLDQPGTRYTPPSS